ncbi:MAG: squalene synthase HpnC [Firmicutes bacterium]|nr:squalene synthase HpnC [Bacillota bacterium]
MAATQDDIRGADFLHWSKKHYENFTVVSLLLPRRLRRPVRLLYAYCRYVDDLGDEAPGDRLARLDAFEQDLERCYGGTPRHPLLQTFQPVIVQYGLPRGELWALIEANRMDQVVRRYETFSDLVHYCRHSAMPVGRLFLKLLGYDDARRIQLSDATRTGLQLVNFLQDVGEDYEKGRIYLPGDDMARFGVSEEHIARRDATPEFRTLMQFEADRARALLYAGLPLAETVEGLARVDVRLFSYGGLAVLDALADARYDVFGRRVRVGKLRKAGLFLRAALWLLRSRRLPPWKGECR